MLIRVDRKGIRMLYPNGTCFVHGVERFYYIGARDDVPAVVVVIGTPLIVGDLWYALSGNERGFPGMCRVEHERRTIGKLTLRAKREESSLEETDQVLPLSFQLEFFIMRWGIKARGR